MFQIVLLTALICIIPSICAFVFFWLLIANKIAMISHCESKVDDMAGRLEQLRMQISDIDIPRYEALLARIAEVDKAAVMVNSRVEGLTEQFGALVNRMHARERTERRKTRDEARSDEEEQQSPHEQLELLPQYAHPLTPPATGSGRTRRFGAMPNHLTTNRGQE